jgi:hypothetical protein
LFSQGTQNLRYVDGLARRTVERLRGPVDFVQFEFTENHHPLDGGSSANAKDHNGRNLDWNVIREKQRSMPQEALNARVSAR